MLYELRFWAGKELPCNIKVGGKYRHLYSTYKDAYQTALDLLEEAYSKGAVAMDINNDFYPIIND